MGVQQNAFHFVAMPRADVPAPVGGVLWFGCDDQSLSVRFPAYTASTAVPGTWVEGADQNRTVFKMRSSHWAFNLVANLVYARWSAVHPIVQRRVAAREEVYFADLAAMDAAALTLLRREGRDSAVRALTNFTVATGDRLVDEWNALFGDLFVRFSYGFDATPTPRAQAAGGPSGYAKGGTATVHVVQPGYDDAWYARISADAGEKYHVPDGVGDAVDPSLSADRLQYI